MRALILILLCCLLDNGASVKVYATLEQAEEECIQKSSLSETTSFKYQCTLKNALTGETFHFVHFDRARVLCLEKAPCGGFVCAAIKPVGVEPLTRRPSAAANKI